MDPFFFSEWGVVFSSFSLDIISASDSVKGAWELDEKRIANGLDLSSVVTIQNFSNQFSLLFKQRQGERFVLLSQQSVPDYIGEHDRGQPSPLLGRHVLAIFALVPR
jgi:hypothetical protein